MLYAGVEFGAIIGGASLPGLREGLICLLPVAEACVELPEQEIEPVSLRAIGFGRGTREQRQSLGILAASHIEVGHVEVIQLPQRFFRELVGLDVSKDVFGLIEPVESEVCAGLP